MRYMSTSSPTPFSTALNRPSLPSGAAHPPFTTVHPRCRKLGVCSAHCAVHSCSGYFSWVLVPRTPFSLPLSLSLNPLNSPSRRYTYSSYMLFLALLCSSLLLRAPRRDATRRIQPRRTPSLFSRSGLSVHCSPSLFLFLFLLHLFCSS